MMKLLRGLAISYVILATIVFTFFFLHPLIESKMGMTLSGRASAAFDALLEDPDMISEEVIKGEEVVEQIEAAPEDEKFVGDVNKLALDLRRELHQTSQSIDSWEGRLKDILKQDIEDNLESIRKENEEVSQLGQNWSTIRKRVVDLLNNLIRVKSQEFPLLAEDEFDAMVQGKAQTADGKAPRKLSEILTVLRGNETGFAERSEELSGLKAEVFAALLAVDPEPKAQGNNDPEYLSLDQTVRLLQQMDAKKRTKVLTSLQEANAPKAAQVLTRFLTLGTQDA